LQLTQTSSKIKKSLKGRNSVSAEVYGHHNKVMNFKPKVNKKTEEQCQIINNLIQKSFLFNSLEVKDQKILIDAMEQKKFKY